MNEPRPGSAPLDLDQPAKTLSANLYCDRRFHDLLRHVLAPLDRELEALSGPDTLLWFSRYSRRGQHVKVRLHTSDESSWPALRDRITALADGFFATLPEPGAGQPAASGEGGGAGGAGADPGASAESPQASPRLSVPKLPAIDVEDEGDTDYPDRSILWTAFRPSAKTLGNERYLSDHRHLNLFYRCMAASAKSVLAEVAAGAEEEPPLKARQSRLLRLVVSTFFALDLRPEEQIDYLEFHRDWMLRHQLTQAGLQTKAEETIERLDQKLVGMEATVAALSQIIAAQLAPQDDVQEGEADFEEDESAELRSALQAFFAHVRGYRERTEYDLDPYTPDFAFLPLFKVLHGMANQVGVPILNELYTYQILVRAAERAHATPDPLLVEAARHE